MKAVVDVGVVIASKRDVYLFCEAFLYTVNGLVKNSNCGFKVYTRTDVEKEYNKKGGRYEKDYTNSSTGIWLRAWYDIDCFNTINGYPQSSRLPFRWRLSHQGIQAGRRRS